MASQINRAEQLWKNWEEHQKAIAELTGITDNKDALKFKYDFLTKGAYRISVNPSDKEKLFLKVIKTVTSNLQKKLYPNLIVRLFVRAKSLFLDKPGHLRLFEKNSAENLESLKAELKKAGLNSFIGKLDNKLDFESPRIDVESLNKLNDDSKLKIIIHLEKDRFGSYHYNGFTATLIPEIGEAITCKLSIESNISLIEAVNLLQGRPVYKDYENSDSTLSQRWVQVDTKEKTINGESQLISYSPLYDFDLKKEIIVHADKLNCFGLTRESIRKGLEQGSTIAFEIPDKGKFYLNADPGHKTLNFFDQDKKPISFTSILEQIKEPEKQAQNKFKLLIKLQDISPRQSLAMIR